MKRGMRKTLLQRLVALCSSFLHCLIGCTYSALSSHPPLLFGFLADHHISSYSEPSRIFSVWLVTRIGEGVENAGKEEKEKGRKGVRKESRRTEENTVKKYSNKIE